VFTHGIHLKTRKYRGDICAALKYPNRGGGSAKRQAVWRHDWKRHEQNGKEEVQILVYWMR
jgi:hypothetical protein